MTPAEFAQLGWFFGRLAIKQHLLPDLHVRPLVAELFLTENCNLRCVSCACWRDTTQNELTTTEWRDVLHQLTGMGIYKVNFTGGEPLIRKDAVELMGYARDVGVRHTHLNTNALLLTPSKLNDVLDAGVRSFNVSVDGPRNLHDQIRGRVGAFDRTIEHLRHLVGNRDRWQLKIRMNFTVMRDNVAALPRIAALAQQLGVQLYLNLATDRTFLFRDPQVSDLAQIPTDELTGALRELERAVRANQRWLPRYTDLGYIARHFTDVVQADVPCAESQLKLMIHSQGQIGGCWGHDPAFNVRSSSIRAVVDGQHYRREHARLFRKECVGCGSNYSLNLRWHPSTYVDDLLWRVGLRRLAPR